MSGRLRKKSKKTVKVKVKTSISKTTTDFFFPALLQKKHRSLYPCIEIKAWQNPLNVKRRKFYITKTCPNFNKTCLSNCIYLSKQESLM